MSSNSSMNCSSIPLRRLVKSTAPMPRVKSIAKTARGFLLQGVLNRGHVEQLVNELLVDSVAETGEIHGTNAAGEIDCQDSARVPFARRIKSRSCRATRQ